MRLFALSLLACAAVSAQDFTVDTGTKIPLNLLNSVSTKHSVEGDRVYLETVFPIMAGGRIVIPRGSYVSGTVTEIKRPGRVKGRGELYLRFDSLTMANGVTRDFRARLGNADITDGKVDRDEGKVISEGNKKGDLKTIGEMAGIGTGIGAAAGHAVGQGAKGLGIGSASGVALGVATVLLTRGPDAILTKGATIEMVLDRPLKFSEGELLESPQMVTRQADTPSAQPRSDPAKLNRRQP